MGSITIISSPIITGAITIIGIYMLLDSHAFITSTYTEQDRLDLTTDICLLAIGFGISKVASNSIKNTFSYIPKGNVVIEETNVAIHEYTGLEAIKFSVETCIETVRDEIINNPVKRAIDSLTGWVFNS